MVSRFRLALVTGILLMLTALGVLAGASAQGVAKRMVSLSSFSPIRPLLPPMPPPWPPPAPPPTPTPTPTPPSDRRVAFPSLPVEVAQQTVQVIYVPGDYPTIAQALVVAQAGDTVQVAAGTYQEGPLSIPSGVSLVGAGWQSTVIDGNGANVVIYTGPDSLVEDFTIRGSGPGYFDAGLWVGQGSVTVRRNRITDNSAGLWAWCFEPDICAIQVTIEGNIVDGNSSNGINSNEYPVFEVRNNTVVSNGGAGVILNNAASLAENNIIVANASDGLANNAGGTVRYNDVWGNGRDYVGSGPGDGGLSMDPLFRDITGGNYRLHAGSPAVGYGTPAGTDMGALPFMPVGMPPAGVTLTQAGEELWDVNWAGTAAGYYLYYGSCTRLTTIVVDVGCVTTYRLSGVNADGVGYVAVSAYDMSHQESIVTLADGVKAPCPSAPQNLEVGAFPAGYIRLQWRDTSSLEASFQVERAHSSLSPTTYSLVATLPADTTVYTDTPPLLEETYWYRVRAYNANGPSPYSNASYNATFDQVPNLDERYLLVLINEARANPGAFGYPEIAPVAPLAYNPLLNYAAHSHSQAILNSGFQFGHCDPASRCPTERAHAVGYEGGVGENLIQGMTGPEWVESSNQAFMDSEGHRNNMLARDFNEAGLGHTYDPAKGGDSYWKGQYTETFCGRSGVVIPNLPAGIVVPYTGPASSDFTYIVNYYNSDGQAPTVAKVYIDGVPYDVTLTTGTVTNGAYRHTTQLSEAGYHNYYLYFEFSGGSARLPKTGLYAGPGVGTSCVLLGDFNGDGQVGVNDIQAVASRWRCKCEDACYAPRYDMDGDCDIDIVDIMLVVVHWGETCE